MNRKRIAARIAAAVLAVGMIITDVVPTLAAETTWAEPDVEVEENLTGSTNGVSKVIGLSASPYMSTMCSDDDTVEKRYIKPYYDDYNIYLYVPGEEENYRDPATGLFKYENELYASAKKEGSFVCLSQKVAWYSVVPSNVTEEEKCNLLPKIDETNGLYLADGRWYAGMRYKIIYQTDASGNKNKVGEVYFVCMADEVYCLGNVSVTADSREELVEKVKEIYGKRLASTDEEPAYYETNGRAFRDIDVEYNIHSSSDTGEVLYSYTSVCAYARVEAELSFDKFYHEIMWTPVSNDTQIEENGKLLHVGYQVRVNGKLENHFFRAENGETFQTETYRICSDARSKGESANYEVRAIYYTETEHVEKVSGKEQVERQYNIVKKGAWSDVYTYAYNDEYPTIPKVTNLKFKQTSSKYGVISWDEVPEATGYMVQWTYWPEKITSKQELEGKVWQFNAEELNFDQTAYEFVNNDFGTSEVTDENGKQKTMVNKYAYVWVSANIKKQGNVANRFSGEQSDMLCIPLNEAVNTPAITGIKTEAQKDGTFRLSWDDIDENAKVRVYYSTDKSVFETPEYLYSLIAAEGIDDKGTESTSDDTRVKLINTFSLQDKLAIINKKVKYVNCAAGTNEVSSKSFDLEPNKTYYFVAVTYDTRNKSTDRSAITPYVANVAQVAGETRNVAFGYYNDVVASAVVSGKESLTISKPRTTSGKTSIKLKFDRTDYCTGFQIYRKSSGKKYKKVTTTTASYYEDKNLKQNTVYDYKVRAYYYNPDTKAKAYSDYVYFSAETGMASNLQLKLDKKSKTSVKLNWSKVTGATRYEIYRSNTSSTDTTYAQKNGYGNGEYVLSNTKWQRIKTIKKAGTTSYTDKKLNQGEKYSYRVVAYYKSGKKEKCIFAADSIELLLTEPRDVKAVRNGKKIKVTWKKESYASKYEIAYLKYNAEGVAYTDDWVTATTKKTSYTIKNVGTGEYVAVRVRAYGSKKWSFYSTTIYEYGKKLAVVQKVTAKEITEKNAQGKQSTGVKISWKAVSGAAYYMVYRSCSPSAYYNVDKKMFNCPYDECVYIAKECNGDETHSNILYEEYKGQDGTVVGTSAVDRAKLQTGVTYYYYVIAFTHNGQVASEGVTKPASICYKATPSIKKITAKKGKTVVTVNKVNGAKKYVIYRSTSKNKGYKKIGTTTKTTYTDKTTKKGKIYYYKVVAVGTNGLKADFESNPSKPVKVKAK